MTNLPANRPTTNTIRTTIPQQMQNESETKMIEVRCDICNESMTATRSNLQRYGWGISTNYCFCPFHEEEF